MLEIKNWIVGHPKYSSRIILKTIFFKGNKDKKVKK